jgi:predicted transcriptional regulator
MGRLRTKPKINYEQQMPLVLDMWKKGLTQTEIAVELGCSQSTIQKWLKAERKS